jgi:hypothetical protein
MRRTVLAALLLVSIVGTSAAATGRRRAVHHNPGPPAVAAPLAEADSYSVNEGTTLTVAAPGVLANDTLNTAAIASCGPSTGAEVTALGSAFPTANGGSLSLSAEGGFTYTPANGFRGTDTFRYVLRNAGGSAPATVTIIVRAAPMAAGDDAYATEPESTLSVPAPGVLTNDTLGGGRIASFGARTGTEQSSLTATTATARGGSIALRQDGSFTYTPPPAYDDGYGGGRPFLGTDSFRYVIRAEAATLTAGVNIDVDVRSADADYVVTTPGHYYAISGLPGENPVLQLTAGRTYRFRISVASVHPFAILDAPPGSVTNNNITEGTLTFAVPQGAQSYRYRCTTHEFGNAIQAVP